jgi:hypothetical protein
VLIRSFQAGFPALSDKTMQARHAYLLSIFEKLGTPLLAAVAEAIEREHLAAQQDGRKVNISDAEEAERIAGLLKAAAEMGFGLSRQLDLRMTEPAAADGVRLTLATISAPLIANLYRVSGRTPSTDDIERTANALQAVTLFADNYNAAADANVRMQQIDQDFAPADGAQVQLNLLHALMPAVNAICTFSFGRPEKDMLQDVMEHLNASALSIRGEIFGDLPERDGLRAEISLLRAAATIYSQVHFTEMSKLMFLDEQQREQVNLDDRLSDLWGQVDQRLAMLRVMAQTLTGQQKGRAVSGAAVPASAKAATKTGATPPSPFANMTKPVTAPVVSATVQQPAAAPSSAANKSNPMAAFLKPKDAVAGGDQA